MEENKTVTQEQQDVQPFATWMDQAVYDRNGNGIVDDAEKLNGKVEGELSVATAATAAKLNGKVESELVVSYAMNAASAASAATAASANTAASATHAVNANIAASATVAATAENALKLGDKVENQLEVASAQTAGYATNAGTALAAGDAEKLGGVLPSQFMLKAVYDQNGNGIVDNAENAQLLGGKPEGELEVASAQTAATADYAANAGTALAAGDAEKLGGRPATDYLTVRNHLHNSNWENFQFIRQRVYYQFATAANNYGMQGMSFSGGFEFVDRWEVNGSGGEANNLVTLLKEGIRFDPVYAPQVISHVVEWDWSVKTVTFSMMVKADVPGVTYTSGVGYHGAGNARTFEWTTTGDWQVVSFTFETSAVGRFRVYPLYMVTGSSVHAVPVTIKWLQLTDGNLVVPYAPKGCNEEYTVCKQYMRKQNGLPYWQYDLGAGVYIYGMLDKMNNPVWGAGNQYDKRGTYRCVIDIDQWKGANTPPNTIQFASASNSIVNAAIQNRDLGASTYGMADNAIRFTVTGHSPAIQNGQGLAFARNASFYVYEEMKADGEA